MKEYLICNTLLKWEIFKKDIGNITWCFPIKKIKNRDDDMIGHFVNSQRKYCSTKWLIVFFNWGKEVDSPLSIVKTSAKSNLCWFKIALKWKCDLFFCFPESWSVVGRSLGQFPPGCWARSRRARSACSLCSCWSD